MATPEVKRPRPILEKFKTVGGGLAVSVGAISALVTLGVLHQAEAESINGVLVAGAGLLTTVMTLLSQFGIVKTAEPLVTPASDPALVVDGTLVSLVPQDNGIKLPKRAPGAARLPFEDPDD